MGFDVFDQRLTIGLQLAAIDVASELEAYLCQKHDSREFCFRNSRPRQHQA